jgi:hypothetical protein
MEHEYSLRAELDPEWAVQPLTLRLAAGALACFAKPLQPDFLLQAIDTAIREAGPS